MSASNIAFLTQQILSQGTTNKWTGEGFGSAEKNAADMAKILDQIGITDVSQFGAVPAYSAVEEIGKTYNGLQVATAEYPDGTISPSYLSADGYWTKLPADAKLNSIYGLNDGEGGYNQVDSSKVKTIDGKFVVDTGQTTYGNKLTGQTVPITYSERQTGNAWGGTFAGKGNTGYRVEFDAQGNPLFYTTGASSSDVPSWVKPALILGGAYLGLDAASLLGGLGGTTAAGLTAAEAAGLGLTAAEASALGLSASEFAAAAGTAGAGAGLLGSTVTPAAATSSGLLSSALPAANTLGGALTRGALSTLGGAAANSLLGGNTNLSNLVSGGLTTAGGLLQQQTSREAAQAAQAMIDRETAAAKQAAQFRPVGMTSRFGTSNFTYDPVTGQMVSAGYELSGEAKAQQDRFMALSNAGLTQAEQAQAQFAPLQTGAQRLFGLGNQYLAQSPEEVAQRYINQQLGLLQPSRELELANLQNRLQQQGRGGLSVAQGGNLGATTPELQALFNARAQQEAQLAANAQQAGQQQVAFGAGLLGTGAQTMGQYYGGQQAAYAPYTAAIGQVQNLEALGQQPFNMSTQLGQIGAQAGANVGRMGLTGAQISAGLATGAAATTNPYASVLGGLGSQNSLLGQGLANYITGYQAPVNALDYSAYGTGDAGYQNMLSDIYGT